MNYKVKSISFFQLEGILSVLKKSRHENNRKAFDDLMEELLPEIKLYIKRQVAIALQNQTLPKGKYKVEDFTDELYIQAFDNILDLTESSSMHKWLFAKADEVLEDTIIEEEFDNSFFKNIDEYTYEERDAMEEIFTRDGDGDLVMLEDLDDLSYPKQNYVLEDVFVINVEKELIDKISARMTNTEIHRQVETILLCLPFTMRTIFELAVYHNFNVVEIAEIKKIDRQDVEAILTQAKNIIRANFPKKYVA